jgi:hypothetical protein
LVILLVVAILLTAILLLIIIFTGILGAAPRMILTLCVLILLLGGCRTAGVRPMLFRN